MADRETIEVYERLADEWIAARAPGDADHIRWVEENRADGPVVDIGCGPGWHVSQMRPPSIALDAAAAMLANAAKTAPAAHPVQALADALPFADRSLGGAVASRVYLHLPVIDVPAALADLHRAMNVEAAAFACLMGDEHGQEFRSTGPFPGRLFSGWSDDRLRDVCIGAGFSIDRFVSHRPGGLPGRLELRLRRELTLPDIVSGDMKLLVCGLNPSIYSAEVGVGFGRPGNRFWPAALDAGLVSRDRDPRHALTAHGIGMTDLVKRATRRADELSTEEYRQGLRRVERLASWLRPAAICFIGLAGWRAVVDRRAVAGPQPAALGGAPVYLMPSTSGLNAHSRLDDLAGHLRSALDLAVD